MNETDYGDIRPYTDEETVEALARVSRHPMLPVISKYLFPDLPASTMSHMLRGIGGIDQFQNDVMVGVIDAVLARTSQGFTCSGAENLKRVDGKFLAISNHRDIVMDPALIQYEMQREGLPYTEICVGSNLITSQLLEDLMRSNRMIKVIRGIKARELYLSSQRLSQYIRDRITSGGASIWVAQREGRTKNGLDTTEQGLLKMFDMSGTHSFEENFRELHIVPMSISYEYESCDSRKAREVLLRREGPVREEVQRRPAQHPDRHPPAERPYPPGDRGAADAGGDRRRIQMREERPLPGHPPYARPAHHRRVPALEDQLHGA